jgi:aarF domain-containing kinase
MRHTIAVVENVFSRPFSEVFETFDPEPIGSGAIAQVYKATLRPNLLSPSYLSEKRVVSQTIPVSLSPTPPPSSLTPTAAVAVKVLHPHVGDMIRRDVAIMGFFARVLNLLPGVQWLSLEQEVKVFGEMMNEQLDLRHEARNLHRFEENFKHRRSAVSFPRPLEEYTSHDLLVEEFQHAVPLHAFLRYGGGPYDRTMGTMGLDAFLVSNPFF